MLLPLAVTLLYLPFNLDAKAVHSSVTIFESTLFCFTLIKSRYTAIGLKDDVFERAHMKMKI